MTTQRSPNRIAYLTGVYPLASHTFIQREIAALRLQGADIIIASVRRPAEQEIIGEEEEKAQEETYYILAQAKNPFRLLAAHLSLLTQGPGRWLQALVLSLRTNRPGLRGFIWQFFYFLEAGLLARHLQRQGATHIHNHFADSSATVAMLTSALSGVPYSFTIHGPTEFFSPESWSLGEKVARAKRVICISYFARSQVMLFSSPEDWHKLRIVHCGIDPARYDVAPIGDRKGTRFIFVGRLDPVKGLRVLLEAFEKARVNVPDITLSIIGDGEDRGWVEATGQRIGGIDVLGYRSQSEVAKTLAASDVLVLPSFAEGVPVALMEAMASRRPVIATRVGGVSELVDHGVSGELVAPGDVDELANAMVRLAQSPNGLREIGEAGRSKVLNEFDIHAEAAWLKALFDGEGGSKLRPDDLPD